MGCGESKHQVATGNTIISKKDDTKISEGIEIIPEKATNDTHTDKNTNTLPSDQQEESGISNCDSGVCHVKESEIEDPNKEDPYGLTVKKIEDENVDSEKDGIVKESKHGGEAVDDEKEASGDIELKKEDQKDDESSYVLRRDEEYIEANKGAAEESAKLGDVVEEKGSVAETKPETMNEEAVKAVNEENPAKDGEVVPPIAAKETATTAEEKVPSGNEAPIIELKKEDQKDDESSYVLRRDEENIEANKGAAEESAKLDDVVEEKGSVAETKPETKNEEAVKTVNEEYPAKDGEVVPPIAAKETATTAEEKVPSGNEEHATENSAKI